MSALSSLISSRLTAFSPLPPGLALEWPGGCLGVQPAPVRLRLPDLRSLGWLAQGRRCGHRRGH